MLFDDALSGSLVSSSNEVTSLARWSSHSVNTGIEQQGPLDLVSALAAAQQLNIDFLPFKWERRSRPLGHGGTANVFQSPVDNEASIVFKVFRDAEFVEARDPTVQIQDTDKALRIIHGDLKPENVLVDVDESGGNVVKLINFGYSAYFGGPMHPHGVYLPKSEPWHAPEVKLDHSFTLEEAQCADTYSLALVCLWLIFHQQPTSSKGTSGVSRAVLLQLRDQGKNLKSFALDCLKSCKELDNSLRNELLGIFSAALSTNVYERLQGLRKLAALEGINPSEFGTNTSDIVNRSPGTGGSNILLQLGGGYTQGDDAFSIRRSSLQFLRMDLRLQAAICRSLQGRLNRQDGSSAEWASFQLALCARLGFGISPDRNKMLEHLQSSNRTTVDLEDEIQYLKNSNLVYASPVYAQLQERDVLLTEDSITPDDDTVTTKSYDIYQRQITALKDVLGARHESVLRLSQRLAFVSHTLKKYTEADSLRRELSAIWEERLGPGYRGSSTWIHEQGNLAVVISDQVGREDEAEQVYVDLFRHHDKHDPNKTLLVARTFGNLGHMYEVKGDIAKTLDYYKRTLYLLEEDLGLYHQYTLLAARQLLNASQTIGDTTSIPDIVEPLQQRYEDANGPWDYRTLNLVLDIARTYHSREAYDKAISKYKRVLGGPPGTSDPRFRYKTTALAELACLYFHTGRPHEAGETIPLLRECFHSELLNEERTDLQILAQATPQHFDRKTPSDTLALTRDILTKKLASQYFDSGAYKEAEEAYLKALNCGTDGYTWTISNMIATKRQLGETYRRQNRMIEAERVLKEVELEYQERQFTKSDGYVFALESLGLLYETQNRREEAIDCFQRSLQATESCHGQDSLRSIQLTTKLANQYLDIQQPESCEPLYNEIKLKLRQHWDGRYEAMYEVHNLADLERRLGKFEDALQGYEHARQGFHQRFGSGSLEVITTQNNIARVLYKRGNHDECRRLLPPLLARSRVSLGADHIQTTKIVELMEAVLKDEGKARNFFEIKRMKRGVGRWKW
ncbi:kinase-like protein [Apiospora aurea]|uniref:Kinase-like protein n=1 Tax=Apiospora aurea TaxID=335848 RepID=A0ABR1PS94_9PEZI